MSVEDRPETHPLADHYTVTQQEEREIIMILQRLFIIYLVGINILAFALYGIDKYRAAHQKWRISESVLLGVAILGGSVGALLGMECFHHKTRKSRFRVGIPAILVFETILLIALFAGDTVGF